MTAFAYLDWTSGGGLATHSHLLLALNRRQTRVFVESCSTRLLRCSWPSLDACRRWDYERYAASRVLSVNLDPLKTPHDGKADDAADRDSLHCAD